jgi:hypothetical protein
MIILRLAGGLGNQIAQLGAALLLSERVKSKTIIIDDSGLASYKAKHVNQLVNYFDFTRININVVFKRLLITKSRLPRLLPFNLINYPLISDKNFQTALKGTNKYLWMDDYFGSCLTQKNLNREIEILKSVFIQKNLSKQEGCVIHIRGGDYVEFGGGKVASPAFYKNAINKMQQDYGIKKFYVVTNDKEYSDSILKDVDFSFIGGSMKEDFYLIGQFKFRILSSSSFASWASALGVNDTNDGIVLIPSEWMPGITRKLRLPNEFSI